MLQRVPRVVPIPFQPTTSHWLKLLVCILLFLYAMLLKECLLYWRPLPQKTSNFSFVWIFTKQRECVSACVCACACAHVCTVLILPRSRSCLGHNRRKCKHIQFGKKLSINFILDSTFLTTTHNGFSQPSKHMQKLML